MLSFNFNKYFNIFAHKIHVQQENIALNANAGTGMAGQVASVAANVWSEDNVAVFHQLIAATRDFNENKVDPMLRNYEGMGQEAVSTYQA